MNRLDLNSEICCGCAACANVCKHKAITMVEDDRGFIVPTINESKCVNCGLCIKVCDFKKEKCNDCNTINAYSLVCNDAEVVKHSSSGGAFTALSNVILDEGGIIVGSVMESDFTIHHIMTYNTELRDKMRGSKYVQSAMDDVYIVIKNALNEGKKVMFSGTPCQCGAVNSFFANKYENLYIVDFLCHGVPNNKLFKEFIEFLENKYGKRIIDYSFRSKRYGWNAYSNTEAIMEDGTVGTRLINQSFLWFFSRNLSIRESCFHCKYRSQHRCSDVTIADFWGISKLTRTRNYSGASLVLVNSDKGNMLINKAKRSITIKEFSYEMISHRIQVLPDLHPKHYEDFWNEYKINGYSYIACKYFNDSLMKRFDYLIRKFAKKIRLFICQ